MYTFNYSWVLSENEVLEMQRDLPVDDDDRNKLAIISMQSTHDPHVFVGQLKIEYLQIKNPAGIMNAIAS